MPWQLHTGSKPLEFLLWGRNQRGQQNKKCFTQYHLWTLAYLTGTSNNPRWDNLLSWWIPTWCSMSWQHSCSIESIQKWCTGFHYLVWAQATLTHGKLLLAGGPSPIWRPQCTNLMVAVGQENALHCLINQSRSGDILVHEGAKWTLLCTVFGQLVDQLPLDGL